MDSNLLRFTKMHGLGNDFVVLDALSQQVELSSAAIARMASRHTGIGFDQLLLIEEASDPEVDFNYRIFNASGDEVGQCGNGARCVAKYLFDRIIPERASVTLKTVSGLLTASRAEQEQFRIDMGCPQFNPSDIPLLAKQQAEFYTLSIPDTETVHFGAVSMGNPHAVIALNSFDDVDVTSLGRKIAKQPMFPEGVNVGFMVVSGRQSIELRVVERGVGETLACGSGACAAMVVARQLGFVDNKVTVHLLGGDLAVEWDGAKEPVWMTGPAVHIFDGAIMRDF